MSCLTLTSASATPSDLSHHSTGFCPSHRSTFKPLLNSKDAFIWINSYFCLPLKYLRLIIQLGRKVVLGGVRREEHRVLGNSMKLKTKQNKTTS